MLAQGQPFRGDLDGLYEAVLGAEVAQRLGYRLGARVTLSHGSGGGPSLEHGDKPFTVVGILARTGTRPKDYERETANSRQQTAALGSTFS